VALRMLFAGLTTIFLAMRKGIQIFKPGLESTQ